MTAKIISTFVRMRWMFHLGRYAQFLARSFRLPERGRIFFRSFIAELEAIGTQSVGIVALLSVFMGAVICLQTAHQIGGWIPVYTIGFTVRQTMILEFSPTLIPVILAGKVGSSIASQIGKMRVDEQIDALEIMGVNSAGYLALPKILAGILIVPFLVVLSMVLGIGAGAWVGVATGVSSLADFEYGMQVDFKPFDVTYALTKTTVFGFLLTSVPAYHGYYATGGALGVGQSSTRAVVWSVVLIMVSNLALTSMLLN